MNIPLHKWLKANGRRQAMPGDKWYLDFAANLLPAIRRCPLFKNSGNEAQEQATLALTLYFQDAISQNGGWNTFTRLYRERYGNILPFYHTGENYVADEINPEDVSLVLWTQLARPAQKHPEDYTLCNPEDEQLAALCGVAYDLMDVAFEEAPVIETPSAPWMRGTKELHTLPTPPPDILPTPGMNENARRCLEASGGHPLLYFTDYDALMHFFAQTLGWEGRNILPDLAKEREFVLFANTKGILLAHNVAACFRDSHNPMFDEERATTEGYRLFCQPGLCPFDLLRFGMQAGFLADARFPFHHGKAILQDNWDFVARYYLGEYYEGD